MVKQISRITNQSIISELKTFPNQAFIWEIIDGGKSGKIYELTNGAILILENCNDPFVFIAGNLTEQSVQEIVSFLQRHEYPMIYCQNLYHPFFLKCNFDLLLRLELKMNANLLAYFAAQMHNKDIRIIDNIELFKKCFWYEKIVDIYGSAEKFLQHGLGYAYIKDGKVLSEVYASIGNGCAEVGIATHPDHRGKGYAADVLLPLFKKCESDGLTPIWSCQLDNRSSLKAALKLGFDINRYYVMMVPECGNVLGKNLIKMLQNDPELYNNSLL